MSFYDNPYQFDEYRNESSGLDLDDSETGAVLSFLDTNPDTGFTAAEISDGTDIDRERVLSLLVDLNAANLVRKKGEYWAIGAEETLMATEMVYRTTRAMNERYGPEDPEVWLENAVDDRNEDDV